MNIKELNINYILFDYKGNKYVVKKIYNNNAIEVLFNDKYIKLSLDSIKNLMITKAYKKSSKQCNSHRNSIKQKRITISQKSNAIFESKSEFLRKQEKLKKNIEQQRLESLIKRIKQEEINKQKEIEKKKKLEEIRVQKEVEKQIKLEKQRQLQRIIDEQFKKDAETLKSFLSDREIKYLIHFTDKSNVESIRKNGILSKEELEKRKIVYKYNDENRYDDCYNGISLSITEPNYYLLNCYRENKNFNPVYIKIDASILYKEYRNKRIYCITNAGNRSASIHNGSSLKHFQDMFKDIVEYNLSDGSQRKIVRKNENRRKNEPTDTQAEILFFGKIDPKYIISIENNFIKN